MDVRWFICTELIFLRQYINAMVTMNSSTTWKQSPTTVISSSVAQSFQITSLITTSQVYVTVSSTSENSLSSIYTQRAETSTLQPTKALTIQKSSSIILPYVSGMTTSSYVPNVNDKKKKSDGIPLIILIPSAAGGGIFLILITISCCCINRILKRKKNERIFQKYYRPTQSSDSSHNLVEDNNSNIWASQIKLEVESNEEQSIDSKNFEGISNKAFLKAESLPEMNILQEKSPSGLSVDMSIDKEKPTLNKVEDFQEISKLSEDCKGLMKPETARVTDDVVLAEQKTSGNDNKDASLLVLQNLDTILNDEYPQDDNAAETSEILGDNPDKLKEKSGYFVVMYPFETSKNDEIPLEVDTMVFVIESKPSGWSWVANKDDNTGWCPTQYLVRVERVKVQGECEDVQTNHYGYSIPDQRRLKFAVLQSFFGTSPNELSLSKYDIVTVIENSSSGWSWVNKPSVGSGWFPTDYLEPLIFPKNKVTRSSSESSNYLDVINEDLQYASSEEIQKVKKEGHYQEYEAKAYRATHPYTGGKEDELTFKENETILVLQESDTGWWRGSTFLGEGWFPATFVEDPINEDLHTTSDPHEYVEPSTYQEESKKHTASPYEVTELVAKQGQPKKESDRRMVHQVPQGISSHAAKRHKNRAKGKASNLKPCRPAPPPPSDKRFLDTQSSPEQSVFLLTTVSPASLPSTCQVDAPPQAALLPEDHQKDLIQQPEKIPSYLTAPPPSPLPTSPTSLEALEGFPLLQTSPAEDKHANVQENSDSEDVNNVEGVVIVPPRDQSRDTLSKLIKVTKRRSVINPNPHATPPNRPVPVPPPRKARSPQKSTDQLPRPRPIKMPRNFGNKKPDPQKIKKVPQSAPERPPPPVLEKLEEFWNKRLSSSEGSLSEQHLSNIPRVQSVSGNAKYNGLGQREQHHNQCKEKTESKLETKSKERNGKTTNGKDERSFEKKDNEIVTLKIDRTSPKPRPRQRSHDQQKSDSIQQQSEADELNTNSDQNVENATTISNKIPQPSEQLSPDNRRDSAPEVSPRSRSTSDETSENQAKIRPQIKPRSKSLANLFSSNDEEKNVEHDGNQDSKKSLRLHFSDESGQHRRSSESTHPQSRSPQRPKPKTRAKLNDHTQG